MATQASFERHKRQAADHERRVHDLLNKAEPKGAFGQDVRGQAKGASTSKVRAAAGQQRLAIREYKEASRLRPRDVDTKDRLRSACKVLKQLQALVDGPRQIPMRRFLAHYNLSLRYWDMGEARQAIEEAKRARKELQDHGLPCGCAEHNLLLMMQVHTEFKNEQHSLQEAVQRAPEAIGPNYDLGIHFFDKRMMRRAEAQLRLTRDRAKAPLALQLVEKDRLILQASVDDNLCGPPPVDSKKADRMVRLLEDIEDDLAFVASLSKVWCVEEEAGKAEELQETGVRDGDMPQLLPCLHCRYSQDRAACDAWMADLCRRTDISLHLKARRRFDFAPNSRRRSGKCTA